MCTTTTTSIRGWVIPLMLAFVFIVNNPATAGDGKWTTNGPFGGRVFSIEIDPVNNNIIFAGTSNGIFRSTDAGLHWQLSFAAGHAIPSISIYKRNPNIIYAAGGSRVYRSVDGGRSWTIVKNPEVIESPYGTLSNNWMQTAVAVFPNSSSYLYAVDPDGFYFSRDGGDNWANIASSEVLQGGSAPLLVDPNDPNVVYVGGKGFKKTISGDTNWVQMKPAIGNAARINVLKMNPKNPNTLYAIVDNVLPWEPIDPGPGLFRSYDAGSTWIRIDSTLIIGNQDTYNVLAIDPVDTNIIYTAVPINMGTKATILKSIDGGAHWDTLYNYSDEYHVGVNAFAVHPVNNSVVYAGLIQDGMLKTTDGGSTWNVSGYGILGPSHPVLTLHPDQPGTIYVGSMGGYEHGGVFKSMDEGKSWVVINNGLTSTDVRAFAINPDDPNIMFAGTRWGLFMSADGGANWFRNSGIPESEFVQNLIIDPINSSVMYVTNGTDGGTAVWKTEDGGLTWTKIAKVGSGSDGMIIDLEFDPNNSTILYAANQRFTGTSQFGAISKSTDAGVTWTKLKRQGAEKIVAAPSNSQIIFFGTPDKGIYKSVDGGVTWVQKNSGIKSGLFGISVNDIVIDPINSSIIYAGLTNGIYKSVDGGDSWEPFPTDGLYWTDAWIQDITLDARTSTLYASVDNGGVYSYSLNPTIATSSIANIIDIPNDQGKQVRLTFKASANDKAGSERPVVQYGVWRRIEPGSLSNGAASIVNSTSEIFSGDISSKIGKSFYVVNQNKTSAGSEAENIFMDTKSSIHRFNENRERISLYDIATGKSSVRDFNYNINGLSTIAGETTPSIQSNSVLIGYEAVGVVPAIQSENYSFVSPTFIDSTTSSGINYSTFIITAHTQYPLIWSVSLPDSGYSVDNLAPTSPGNLNGIVQNGYALLNWQHVPDYNDFSNFAVYRDTVINFVPDAQKKLGKSVAPIYVDSTSEAGVHYYYKVSALDYAGNESRYSNEIALVVTGVKDEENKIPETFGLSQNYPNPFNPATVISYQLPINSLVTIKIFDVLGKEVVELVNEEKPAGRYEVKFSAKGGSASGGEASSLSSGVYLYRIQAGEFVQTRKMILTK